MSTTRLIAFLLLGLSVAACTADSGPKEVGGTAVGAVTGGLIGKVTKATDDSEVEVEIAPNVRVRLVRSGIADVRSKGEPVKDAPAAKDAAPAKSPPVKKDAANS